MTSTKKQREQSERRAAFHTQLPEWVVEKVGGTLNITCPRKDCGGKAKVSPRWLRSRPRFIGRSCTYCFRTARIPARFPSGRERPTPEDELPV